ncbi:Fc.00g042500.m01.CDS01 [Cosmosporella sp. VM-42]
MGNNSSSEAPRKPHKLSKPRVSTHASAASLSNSNLYALPKNARFSNSYLVGWLPVSPAEPPSNDLTPINIGVAVPGEQIEGRTSVARGGSRRDAKRSGALSSKSSQYDESIKTQANIDPSFRPGSEAQQRFPRPLARAESMPTVCQLGGKRGSVHYDMSSYEVQRLLVTRETLHQPMTKSESYTEVREVTESTWKSSHPASTPVSRANSELTLYMPTRRRSMIQTPGVATRSEQTIERISTRSSFRKSLPPTPSECKENPFESIAKRRMSMPPVQADFGSFMAAQTPSEGEYKQLGGMKFGTLHITNGAPELTPGPDNDGENCRDPRLGVGTVRQGYFERTESSFMTAGVNLDKIEDEEVLEMPSRRPSTKNQSLAEDYSPSRNPPSLKKVDKILPSRSHNSEEEKPTPGSSIAEPVSPTSPLPATPKAAAIGGRTPPEYLSTETLDVKENSDAKANPEMFRLELEHKTMRNLARYDSGISSSPSSETSRKALSKADSGYSSNVSLRSIQSLKRGSTERSQKSSEKLISEVPKRRSSMNPKLKSASGVGSMKKHDRSKSELPPPPPPPPKDDIPPAPTRRSSFSSLALSTINRIPTLRSSKSRDSSLSRSSTKARLGEERVKPANQDLSALVSHGEAKHRGQLQRLLSGSRTKAPSKGRDNHLDDQRPPATQSRAEPRSRRHRRRVPAASHRLELRDRASRDTLRTILSVGSTDMLQTGEKVQTTKPAQSVPKPIPPRKRSLHSISHSITQATSNLFLSKKPSVNKIEVPADVQIDSTRPEIILSHEARASGIDSVQRSMGNSAFDQAFTAIPVDRGSFSQRKRALTKMQYMEIRSNDQTAPLKTQNPGFISSEEEQNAASGQHADAKQQES